MPIVIMPDGQKVNMPDQPSEEELQQFNEILRLTEGQGQVQPPAEPPFLLSPLPPVLGHMPRPPLLALEGALSVFPP